jgi:hypothetical protein
MAVVGYSVEVNLTQTNYPGGTFQAIYKLDGGGPVFTGVMLTTDAQGSYNGSFTVTGVASGNHTLTVEINNTPAPGNTLYLTPTPIPFTVSAPTQPTRAVSRGRGPGELAGSACALDQPARMCAVDITSICIDHLHPGAATLHRGWSYDCSPVSVNLPTVPMRLTSLPTARAVCPPVQALTTVSGSHHSREPQYEICGLWQRHAQPIPNVPCDAQAASKNVNPSRHY